MTYHSHCPNCLNQHSELAFSIFFLSNASFFCYPKVLKSPSTTTTHVFLGRPLDLGPATTKFIHCFTQSSSDFLCTWPNHRNLFLCNNVSIPSIPNLCLSISPVDIYDRVKFQLPRSINPGDSEGVPKLNQGGPAPLDAPLGSKKTTSYSDSVHPISYSDTKF